MTFKQKKLMTFPDETLDIQTPENVAFGYQIAGIGSRFLATLLDTLFIILLEIAIIIVRAILLAALDQSSFGNDISPWVVALFGLISFLFYSGYYVLFEMLWNGQTPAKRWMGLRVICRDGTPITLSESLIRNLARLVDFLPFAYGVGLITMFIDKQSRRLGDLAAGTLVVHDRAPISIQELSVKREVHLRPWAKVDLDGFPFERLTENDLNLIEGFLQRRAQLTHRDQLAVQLLNTLHQRLGLPAPTLDRFRS